MLNLKSFIQHSVFSLLIGSAAFLSSFNAMAGPALAVAPLAPSIEKIINKYGPGINVGIEVQSLNNGNVIYQRNANQLYMPASSLKTFTAAAALSTLGPNYTFKTRMLTIPHSIDNQGTLNSDIYFYFDGDPTLTRGNLNELIAVLTQLGVHSVNGNIYLDDSIFDTSESGPGWMWDELNLCYAAPVSAINIDHNCFPLSITSAPHPGQPPSIKKYLGYDFLNFTNNAITSNSSYEDCPLTLRGTENNNYVIDGCIHLGTGTWSFPVAVRDMRAYSAAIISQLFAQNRIHLNGEIKFAQVPATKQLAVIAGHNSAPLSTLVKIMLKKSDNLIADALYKKLGNSYSGNPGSWSNGAKAIANIFTTKAHIDFSKIKIVDGCGLSRHNLITPHSLVALLNSVYRDAVINNPFITALPISGVDGHLQGRMINLKDRIHAKTGTMKSTTALAGYIYTASNQVLSFSIMINDFTESVHKYQKLEDEICTLLAVKL